MLRYTIAIGFTLLILVAAVWYFCLYATPLKISPETTYITAPLMSDGKRVDYFRAMEEKFYPPEMKTEDNGYRLLVRAMGVQFSPRGVYIALDTWIKREDFDPEPLRLQVYEKLGLDPNEQPTMKPIVSPYDIIVQYDKEHPPVEGELKLFDRLWNNTFWTFDEFPMLKDWLDENMTGIDLLAEAVRKPVFFIPSVREHEDISVVETRDDLNDLVGGPVRKWARIMRVRATYRLGIGDIDGAIDDIMTLHLLSRHAGKHGSLTMGIPSALIEGVGYSIGIGSNPEFPPTKEQIERLMREMDALPPRPTLGDLFEMERYWHLNALQDAYHNNGGTMCCGGSCSRETGTNNIRLQEDFNVVMKGVNKHFDEQINETFEIAKLSRNPLQFLPFFTRGRANWIVDSFITEFIPAIQREREARWRAECAGNMQRLTLALLLYEKDHGKLPDGDWLAAIRPYLGENADTYFRCPGSAAADNETTYVMIGGASNQVLLVETHEPQTNEPLTLESVMNVLGSNHSGSVNVGLRNGAVRSLDKDTAPDELRKLFDGSDGL